MNLFCYATIQIGSLIIEAAANGTWPDGPMAPGTYTVTAIAPGYTVKPAARRVTVTGTTNVSGVDFTGTAQRILYSYSELTTLSGSSKNLLKNSVVCRNPR